ncbi:MAG: DUF4422 domain-containing protein [Bacteroidia bacterium]|nr:DUF4422 domain-containing protein [Bacteroidia bacterium]
MRNSDNCKIYVFHYKNGEPFPDLPCYIHILAGKETYLQESNLTGDNTGENISNKNQYYSELTGIFWVYKNQTSDIVGTCHYRRFFTTRGEPLLYKLKRFLYYFGGLNIGRHGLIYTSNQEYWGKRILTCDEAKLYLDDFDAIMPIKRKLRQSVESHYNKYHDASDLQLLRIIISEKAPEYSSSFESTLKQKRLYANNMMIMKRKNFVALCDWLFMLLFEFEKRIDLTNYEDYQQRIFGFVSERLITTWFNHHQLKVKEFPLIYFRHLKNG